MYHDVGSIVYAAIIRECESLEHRDIYLGNGHHLAQRLLEMVKNKLIEENCQVVKKVGKRKVVLR